MIATDNPLRPSRLLVVDDTDTGRATVAATLIREGHEIIEASSGPECLRLAVQHMPDLILLDVMMPGMDGYEVCRRLRADPRTRDIGVVMVTALSDDASMARGIEAGADDFIGKPFNKWELRARVSSLARLGVQRRMLAERDRFSWVFEHATDGFVLLNRDGQILHANAAARRFLGFSEGDAAHGDFIALVTAHNVPQSTRAWDRWGTVEGNDTPVHLLRTVDGTAHTEWLQVTPHREAMDPDGMTIVNLRDVTAQVERTMRQFDFHEMVSHKLRTPLMGVVAAVDLLGFDSALLPRKDAQLIDVLKISAQRLSKAVIDVLEFADHGTAHEAPFRLEQLAALVQASAEEQQIAHLTVDVDPALDRRSVQLGESSMRTIFGELIENSRRFHPTEDPIVTVRVTPRNGAHVQIDVVDDGISLTPRQLERVLEPYVQADPEVTGEVPGMGLGLSLVATRVRSAGGRCLIENRGDRPGVRVRIVLPSRAD
jgi:two-component system cell cycle response regulator